MYAFGMLLMELLDIRRPPLHELAMLEARRMLEQPLGPEPLSADCQDPADGPRITQRYAASLATGLTVSRLVFPATCSPCCRHILAVIV